MKRQEKEAAEAKKNSQNRSPGTPRKGKKGQPAPEPPHFDYDFQDVSEENIESFAREKAEEEAGPAPPAPDERIRAFKALLGRNDTAKLLSLQDPEIISLDYERFNGEKAAAEAAAGYRASQELEEKAAELA